MITRPRSTYRNTSPLSRPRSERHSPEPIHSHHLQMTPLPSPAISLSSLHIVPRRRSNSTRYRLSSHWSASDPTEASKPIISGGSHTGYRRGIRISTLMGGKCDSFSGVTGDTSSPTWALVNSVIVVSASVIGISSSIALSLPSRWEVRTWTNESYTDYELVLLYPDVQELCTDLKNSEFIIECIGASRFYLRVIHPFQ